MSFGNVEHSSTQEKPFETDVIEQRDMECLNGEPLLSRFTPEYYENLVACAFAKFTKEQEGVLLSMIVEIEEAKKRVDKVLKEVAAISEENRCFAEELNFLNTNGNYSEIVHFQEVVENIRRIVAIAHENLLQCDFQVKNDQETVMRFTHDIDAIDLQIITLIDRLSHISGH